MFLGSAASTRDLNLELEDREDFLNVEINRLNTEVVEVNANQATKYATLKNKQLAMEDFEQ
ncbi:hypothetical protein RND71_003061 [Anisodus tanguticus]|uniref:Uncharacterized protein n=1 Tax=Anisodus tanguticus TaxID=243964 RepID=A0AAE1VWW7_9SOLA|nr:hypothetical protein RND71_003061 [Anisodus tanguticus]